MNKDREIIYIVRKKKNRHGGGHHGGAWKVAFADFMTSMMALFLVLWIVSQSSDIRSAIAGYFQDPLGTASEFGASVVKGEGTTSPPRISRAAVLDVAHTTMSRLGQAIQEKLQDAEFQALANHIEIQVTDQGLRIQLVEDSTGVFFQTGSATPRPEVSDLLKVLGLELGTQPNPVMIEGYTDAVPYKVDATYTNWELSTDRANVARRLLVQGGLKVEQVHEVRGHADKDLREPDHPTAAGNRRVTITMMFDTTSVTPVAGPAAAPAPAPVAQADSATTPAQP